MKNEKMISKTRCPAWLRVDRRSCASLNLHHKCSGWSAEESQIAEVNANRRVS